MSRIATFLSGAGIAAAVLLFGRSPQVSVDDEVELWRARAQKAERELAMLRARPEPPAPHSPAPAPSRADTSPAAPGQEPSDPTSSPRIPMPPPPPDTEFDPMRQAQWDALVSSALEREVEQRLGQRLSPERMTRLLDGLRRLREASVGLRPEFLDPSDPESLRDHLARTLVLVESDRLLREELGIGFSDFLRGLDGDPIEEVHPAKPGEPVR